MSLQLAASIANARLDAFQTAVGNSPLLRLYTGAAPANCAASEVGTKLVEMALPASFMNAASGGSKIKNGTWTGSGLTNGVAGHYRIYDSTGTTCLAQGTVTVTGSGGDMTMDNTNIATSQVVAVNTFTLTDGNYP